MSGHSKWAKIKRQKGAKDIKKGALFTKIAKNITLAAKEGGGSPDTNFALRLVIDKAKTANMPSDNIERAIRKGTGEEQSVEIHRISYEAFGPSQGVSIIIDVQTDNTNRTISEIRNIIESAGGKMAGLGSVSWKFVEKGLIVLKPARLVKSEQFGKEDKYEPVNMEEMQLELLEIEGIEDISEVEVEGVLEVLTSKTDFAAVLKRIENLNYQVISAELMKISSEKIALSEENRSKLENLLEELENHDDVDAVWVDV